jgi:hypothetical protein
MSEKRYAVLIASSQFPEEPKLLPLACPENDVEGLKELLSSEAIGFFTEVRVLKNRPHHEVLRTVNEMLKKAEKDDFVLFYYSGHGKLDPAGRLHLATMNTELSVLEATSIPVQSIRNYIDSSVTTKTALVLDCCYSGAVGKAFLRGDVDDQLNLTSGGRGTYILSAGTAVQTAQEKESDRYGVFTKHVIEAIREGEADRDGDGLVTMNELYRYVHDRVLEESHQEPMKWDLNVRGELVFSKSGKAPREERRQQVRENLFDLSRQRLLPDDILTKALKVLATRPDQLAGDLSELDSLLDRLMHQKVGLGDFIQAWYEIERRPPVEPGPPPRREEPAAARVVPPPQARPEVTGGAPVEAQAEVPVGGDARPQRMPSRIRNHLTSFGIVILHVMVAGLLAALIDELTYRDWYGKEPWEYDYVLDDAVAFAVFVFSSLALVVSGVIGWVIRGAMKGRPRAARVFAKVFPRGYAPRTALKAWAVGLLLMVLLTGAALIAQLERAM